jgi:hypothetical protein
MSQAEILHSIMSNPGSPNESNNLTFDDVATFPKPPGASRNSFKPLYHHLPQFKTTGEEMEIYHKLDVKNIINDKDKIRIPSKWKTIPILQKERFIERKSMNEKVFENFLQKEEIKKEIIEKMVHCSKVYSDKKPTLSEVKLERKNFIEKVHTLTELKHKRVTDN